MAHSNLANITPVTDRVYKEQEIVPVKKNSDFMLIRSFDDLDRWAKMVSKSILCPERMRNKPEEIVAAVAYGLEVGLKPMQSLHGIDMINGIPAMRVKTIMALCKSHPEYKKMQLIELKKDGAIYGYKCKVYRRLEEIEGEFTIDDAKTAKLNQKTVWQNFPRDMLINRAISRAFKLCFPDVLHGITSVEEANDSISFRDVSAERAEKKEISAEINEEEITEIELPASQKISNEELKILKEKLALAKDPARPGLIESKIHAECRINRLEDMLASNYCEYINRLDARISKMKEKKVGSGQDINELIAAKQNESISNQCN